MNARQKKAEDLARELGKMPGCWVVSPLPLDDDARGLRVQILDSERDKVITTLCEWKWLPAMVQNHPRFCPDGLKAASLFEVEIPKERQSVLPDSPKVSGELARREKPNVETEAIRRYLGWK
jgi:hypothetical protein